MKGSVLRHICLPCCCQFCQPVWSQILPHSRIFALYHIGTVPGCAYMQSIYPESHFISREVLRVCVHVDFCVHNKCGTGTSKHGALGFECGCSATGCCFADNSVHMCMEQSCIATVYATIDVAL